MSTLSVSEEEVRRRIRHGESKFVERKKSVSSGKDILKTLVAFANALKVDEWAVLFIGVEDDGNVVGVPNSEEVQKTISAIARDKCYPAVECDLRLLRIEDKEVVAVVIPYSSRLPHFSGHAFVRDGPENKSASEDQFKELIFKHHSKTRKILESKGKSVSIALYPPPLYTPIGQDALSQREYRIVDCGPHEIVLEEVRRQTLVRQPITTFEICSTSIAGRAHHLIFRDVDPQTFYFPNP